MKTENAMNLNRDNYEAYLLDYLEDRLDTAQKRQVDAFLAQNPAIAADFRNLRQEWNGTGAGLSLSVPQEEYPDKTSLIRLCLEEKTGAQPEDSSLPESSPKPSVPHTRSRKTHIRFYRHILPPALALAACLSLFFLFAPVPKTEMSGKDPEKILLGKNKVPNLPEKEKRSPIPNKEGTPREKETPAQPNGGSTETPKKNLPENKSLRSGETPPEENTRKANEEKTLRKTEPEQEKGRLQTAPEPVRREEMLFQIKSLTRQKPLLAQTILPRREKESEKQENLPEYASSENETGTIPVRDPKPIEIFFTQLIEAWTEPIQENIDQIRIRRQWKQQQENRKQESYQAYWEEESEF